MAVSDGRKAAQLHAQLAYPARSQWPPRLLLEIQPGLCEATAVGNIPDIYRFTIIDMEGLTKAHALAASRFATLRSSAHNT